MKNASIQYVNFSRVDCLRDLGVMRGRGAARIPGPAGCLRFGFLAGLRCQDRRVIFPP